MTPLIRLFLMIVFVLMSIALFSTGSPVLGVVAGLAAWLLAGTIVASMVAFGLGDPNENTNE